MSEYNYSSKRRKTILFKRIRGAVITLAVLAAIVFGASAVINHMKKTGSAEVPTKVEEVKPEGAPADTPSASSSTDSTAAPQTPPASAGGKTGLSNPGSNDWRTILVSAAYPLESEMDVELTTVANRRVDARVADALRAFLNGAKTAGYNLQVISGYRSFARSGELYDKEVQHYLSSGYSKADAEKAAAEWVAPPGTSEHNTGLAMDIISVNYYDKHGDLETAFESDPEAVWMKEHCAEYGFILRYPKGKTEVTGIGFEPWHFRYVGVEAATYIMQNNLTLEEYLHVG